MFEESFVNNNENWLTSFSGELRAWIEPEVYHLEFDATERQQTVVYSDRGFDFSARQFRLHGLLQWLHSAPDASVGLAWNIVEPGDYCAFMVSPTGSFRVTRWRDHECLYFSEWMTSDAIHLNNALNWLEVRRDGADLYFFINSQLVLMLLVSEVMPYPTYNEFGFALCGCCYARAHYLKMDAEPSAEATPSRRARRYSDDKLESSFELIPVPRHDSLEHVMRDLAGLTGLESVKREFVTLTNTMRVQAARGVYGLPSASRSLHLAFMGPPGTGKTTVARLVGRLYRVLGLLERGHVIETDRSGVLGGYTGQTVLKTEHAIQQAIGGVLFIDEAYALLDDNYGTEVIQVLVKSMEDHRAHLAVVMAGYPTQMQELFSSNPGLRSRFNRSLHFEPPSPAQMLEMLRALCAQHAYELTPAALEALEMIFLEARTLAGSRFGNGRFVRNTFEKLVETHANRVSHHLTQHDRTLLCSLKLEDVLALTGTVQPLN